MYLQNTVYLDGNLCGDIEIKETTKGTKYCHFSICHNESYKDKTTNEWKSVPNFFNCEAWGKTAETCAKYKKGELVSVIGKMKSSAFTDENQNQKKYDAIVIKAIRKLTFDVSEPVEQINETETFDETELNEAANKGFDIF